MKAAPSRERPSRRTGKRDGAYKYSDAAVPRHLFIGDYEKKFIVLKFLGTESLGHALVPSLRPTAALVDQHVDAVPLTQDVEVAVAE